MPVPTNTFILRGFEREGKTIKTTHITTNPPSKWKITLKITPEAINCNNTTPHKIYFAVIKTLVNRHKEMSQDIDAIQINFLTSPSNAAEETMREQVEWAALYFSMSQRIQRRNAAMLI
jgi:hypothetical protein